LRSRGWQQVERIGEEAGSVWKHASQNGEGFEILLPYDRTYGDYLPRLADLLGTLEVAEERSKPAIVNDLLASTVDVIRIQLQSAAYLDGTVPIEDGVRFFAHARDLLLAAACAAVQPNPVYQPRKPTQATDYMNGVRLAQTERGSYVLTMHSSVPPRLEANGQNSLFREMEEPFERKVTLTLARALAAVRTATEGAAVSGTLQPFTDAVAHGVSANLCDALAGLGMHEATETLVIQVSWAPVRAVPANMPSLVRLNSDTVPVLREVARVFRENAPRDDFELRGVVVGLRREEGATMGHVTIAAIVDGNLRKVLVNLESNAYQHAIEAHRREQPITCSGELVREGRSYLLRNPRNLFVEPEVSP